VEWGIGAFKLFRIQTFGMEGSGRVLVSAFRTGFTAKRRLDGDLRNSTMVFSTSASRTSLKRWALIS